MKFNFIELPWCQRQSLPANFHESQYDSWQWWSLETWFRCLETRFLESRSWSRTSQVSSRSRTISVSVLGLEVLRLKWKWTFAVFGRLHKFRMIFIILIFGDVPFILLLRYSRS